MTTTNQDSRDLEFLRRFEPKLTKFYERKLTLPQSLLNLNTKTPDTQDGINVRSRSQVKVRGYLH